MNKSDWERHADDVALARYSVISPLVCRQLTAEERLAAKAEILAAVHLFPDGKKRKVSRRTLERFCSWYEGGHTTEDGEVVTEPGIEALRPLPRFDKGVPRVLDDDLVERAIALRREDPARTTSTLIELLPGCRRGGPEGGPELGRAAHGAGDLRCTRIALPCKDPNQLLSERGPTALREALTQSEFFPGLEPAAAPAAAAVPPQTLEDGFRWSWQDLTLTVTLHPPFRSRLRATLRVERGGLCYRHGLDLASYRARTQAGRDLARRFALDVDQVERLLLELVDEAERWVAAALERQQDTRAARVVPAMSETEREEALAFLRRPDLIPRKHEQRLSLSTQARRLSAVKAFLRYLLAEGYVVADPAAGVALPREPHDLPRARLSEEETERLLEAVATPLGLRDRAILEVLYGTGIRNGELVALTLDAVDLAREELRIHHGKGGKSRVVPLGEEAQLWLRAYLATGRPRLLGRRPDPGAVFLSWRGHPLRRSAVCALVVSALQAAGLEKKVTPHGLRHGCATHMLRHGAGLRHLQALLGHEQVNTTQRYLRVEVTDLREVMTRCHPRERAPEPE